MTSHSIRRSAKQFGEWQNIPLGTMPDAFFPYRTSSTPFMCLNNGVVQSTNSIHRIYFHADTSSRMRRWIQISLLSEFGQVFLEAYSRHYGAGVLKVEPGTLECVLVMPPLKSQIPANYWHVDRLLRIGDRRGASLAATEEMVRVFPSLRDMQESARKILSHIRSQRGTT